MELFYKLGDIPEETLEMATWPNRREGFFELAKTEFLVYRGEKDWVIKKKGEAGEGLGLWEEVEPRLGEYEYVGHTIMKFRQANVETLISWNFEWCGEFYRILWDMLVERKDKESIVGHIWLPISVYGFKELETLRTNIRNWSDCPEIGRAHV
jgi:hypothetical protein